MILEQKIDRFHDFSMERSTPSYSHIQSSRFVKKQFPREDRGIYLG